MINVLKYLLLAAIFIAFRLDIYAQLRYSTQIDPSKPYKVILMAGQSNMVGVGKVSEIDNKKLPDNVVYFNFGLNPDFSQPINSFGPEVGVSQQLAKYFPHDNFIVIKYAIGGASQMDWAADYDAEKAKITGFPQFGNMFAKFQNKVDSITDELQTETVALLWMQGERDARVPESGVHYYENFRKLIQAFRKESGNPNLPIIYGQVNPRRDLYPAVDTVRLAQEKIAEDIPNTYLIQTDDLSKVTDQVHYDTTGQLKLGNRMGRCLIDILKGNQSQ